MAESSKYAANAENSAVQFNRNELMLHISRFILSYKENTEKYHYKVNIDILKILWQQGHTEKATSFISILVP